MLPKATRKKLIEHNWVEIERRDSNPYQTLHRLRTMATRAVNDLILIAQRLPDEAQKEIFNYKNIKELASAILKENDPIVGDSATTHDVRRLQLAALLVEIGMRVCIEQYQTKIEQDSVLNDLTINHLSRARDICNAISFKVRLPQVEEEAKKEDLIYLFNWNRIEEISETKVRNLRGEDTKKLVNLLQDIYCKGIGIPVPIIIDVINTIRFTTNVYAPEYKYEMIFEFTDSNGYHCDGRMQLVQERAVYLSMESQIGTRTVELYFGAKVENENVYVYKKAESASKVVT